MSAGETVEQLRDRALAAMDRRGLNNLEQLLEPVTRDVYEVVLDACEWFDQQGGRAGTGVLATEIRTRLERRSRSDRTSADAQRVYGEQILAWLREHFPTLQDSGPSRLPHPAAVACVIRLHHRHGKDGLDPQVHGAQIRAAVERFEKELAS